jgi:FixJ family two-component response regulator
MSKDNPIVYVLDDEYRVREALTSFLSSVGFRVEVLASAAEYLKFKKPESPACLILDLQLLGMSGLDLQREIAGGDVPAIVFVTGHGSSWTDHAQNGASSLADLVKMAGKLGIS